MPDIIQRIKDAYIANPASALALLSELFKQYDEGLIKVLPCKVGDKLYRIFNGEIEEYRVQNVLYESLFSRFKVFTIPYMCIYWKDSFGKTVFLTREAAEKALEDTPCL